MTYDDVTAAQLMFPPLSPSSRLVTAWCPRQVISSPYYCGVYSLQRASRAAGAMGACSTGHLMPGYYQGNIKGIASRERGFVSSRQSLWENEIRRLEFDAFRRRPTLPQLSSSCLYAEDGPWAMCKVTDLLPRRNPAPWRPGRRGKLSRE